MNAALYAYAEGLRVEGKTYAEIVSLCSTVGDGVTLNWCKRNLKEVKIAMVSDEAQRDAACFEEITASAKRKKGITPGEAYAVIRRVYGLFGSNSSEHNERNQEDKVQKELLDNIYKRVKHKVTRAHADALFRPASVNPYKAVESKKVLFELAHEIYECIESVLESYKCLVFQGSEEEWHRNSVLHELLTISCPSLHLKGGMLTRCEYLDSVCDKLDERLPDRGCHAIDDRRIAA